jgi:hypothetical protein
MAPVVEALYSGLQHSMIIAMVDVTALVIRKAANTGDSHGSIANRLSEPHFTKSAVRLRNENVSNMPVSTGPNQLQE